MSISVTVTPTQNEITVTPDWAARTITVSVTRSVAESRTIATTAPLTGGGDLSADRTLAISAATTAAAGSMSAADKLKLDGLSATVAPVTRAAGDYTLGASDAGTQQVVTAAAVITVPANTLPVGSIVGIIAQTAGAVSVLASGVTINSENGLILNAENAAAALYCSATNVFTLAGSLKAS